MPAEKKDLNYYLSLNYPVELIETDEGFVVSNSDLPGCQSFGDTASAALEGLRDVRSLWLEGYIAAHGVAPEPKDLDEYSGKFVLRLPKSLHRDLEKLAQKEGTSLNQLAVSLITRGVSEQRFYSQCSSRMEALLQQFSVIVPPNVTFTNMVDVDDAYQVLRTMPRGVGAQFDLPESVSQNATLALDEEALLCISDKLPNTFFAKFLTRRKSA
jgi:predicted HicB family RNase H-like nuclease